MKTTLCKPGILLRSAIFSGAIILSMTCFAQWYEAPIKSFWLPAQSIASPATTPILGFDGSLYGTAATAAPVLNGVIYRLATDGSSASILRTFTTNGMGWRLNNLMQGSDGLLYGTTSDGGSSSAGTVFRLSTNGAGYGLLHEFATNGIDGAGPLAGVIQGTDGRLYGTTSSGGSNGSGTVFALNADGSDYTVLYSFTNSSYAPVAPLVQGIDGALYGTTSSYGIVFKLNTDGSSFSILHNFGSQSNDGLNPVELMQASDGRLYGTTSGGGSNRSGTIFGVNTDGTSYLIMHNFGGPCCTDGELPLSGLLEAQDGTLVGTTSETASVAAERFSSSAPIPPAIPISIASGVETTMTDGFHVPA